MSAIVLDLDDTLALEVDFVRSGFAAVAGFWVDHNPENDTRRRCWEAFQASPRGVLGRVGRQLGLEDEVVRRAVDIYRTHRPRLSLCPDAARMLERIPVDRLAVISDGDPRTQRQKVEALGLRDLVAIVILTGETEGWGKPSDSPFRHVLSELGADPRQSVYFGDNGSKDFVGPRVVGMRSVHVIRPQGVYRNVACPDDGLPNACVTDLDEGLDVIVSWGLL